MNGFIKLHRGIIDWEWYDDSNTLRLFIHLLLKANFKDKNWHGITIKRGQMVASSSNLAAELKLSRQNIRTSLKKLEKTENLTIRSTNKYIIITICKYDSYQEKNGEKNGNQPASQPSTNHQLTINQPSTNHQLTTTKEGKKERRKEGKKELLKEKEKEIIFPFESDDFRQTWNSWIEYKKDQHGFKYKSIQSEQAALLKLSNMAQNKDEAIGIILNSMSNGWKGFFKIKNNHLQNGSKITKQTLAELDRAIDEFG